MISAYVCNRIRSLYCKQFPSYSRNQSNFIPWCNKPTRKHLNELWMMHCCNSYRWFSTGLSKQTVVQGALFGRDLWKAHTHAGLRRSWSKCLKEGGGVSLLPTYIIAFSRIFSWSSIGLIMEPVGGWSGEDESKLWSFEKQISFWGNIHISGNIFQLDLIVVASPRLTQSPSKECSTNNTIFLQFA